MHALGFNLEVVQRPEDLDARGDFIRRPIPLTEPLEGPDAQLLRHLSEKRPALLIIDLNSKTIPWARWIQVIKTSAATHRIPILAFGPHVNEASFTTAETAGADIVISRGKFQTSLPELIEQWAQPSVAEELLEACSGKLSSMARAGIELHNQMEFVEAHEELESAWMEAPEHEGYLYRALLQTSAAFLHLERGNLRGATKMLLRVRQWLNPLPDKCRGVDIRQLRETIEHLRGYLDVASGTADLPEIDQIFQPFSFTADSS